MKILLAFFSAEDYNYYDIPMRNTCERDWNAMKKTAVVLLLLPALLLLLAACGKSGDQTPVLFPIDEKISGGTRAADAPTEEASSGEAAETQTDTEEETETEPEETETEAPETEAPTQAPTEAPQTAAPTGTSTKGYSVVQVNGVYYVDGVLVANKTYSLPADYNPGGLTAETGAAFARMQSAAEADGISLYIQSGFRSYELQESLYSRYVSRDGQAAADRYSARPGHSEHQTGLAIDVNDISYSFADTPAGKWLAANCAKYGFILRYPQDKEAQTGYRYEPWHIRYVGVDVAAAITNSGLCLEEYYGISSVYS